MGLYGDCNYTQVDVPSRQTSWRRPHFWPRRAEPRWEGGKYSVAATTGTYPIWKKLECLLIGATVFKP